VLCEPFCPVDTVLLFTVFDCIVSVLINEIFIHSGVKIALVDASATASPPLPTLNRRMNHTQLSGEIVTD